MPIHIVTYTSGNPIPARWSGKNVPSLEEKITLNLFGRKNETTVKGYFVEGAYFGVILRLTELPDSLEQTRVVPTPLEVEKGGLPHLLNYGAEPTSFSACLFGREIEDMRSDTPASANRLFDDVTGINEEFACLCAAISEPTKTWKETLRTAWLNGSWKSTPYANLCGELQRIRNTHGMEFVEYAVKKNANYITLCREAIARGRSYNPYALR